MMKFLAFADVKRTYQVVDKDFFVPKIRYTHITARLIKNDIHETEKKGEKSIENANFAKDMTSKEPIVKKKNLGATVWSHCKKTLHGVKSFCHKTRKEGGNVMQKKNLVSKFGGTIKKNLNSVKSFFNKQKEKTLSKICDNLKKANFNQGFFDQIGTQDKVVHIQSKSDSFHYVPKFLMAVFAIPKRVFFCYNDFLIRKNKKKKKKFFF